MKTRGPPVRPNPPLRKKEYIFEKKIVKRHLKQRDLHGSLNLKNHLKNAIYGSFSTRPLLSLVGQKMYW